jgi:hypothetical protein
MVKNRGGGREEQPTSSKLLEQEEEGNKGARIAEANPCHGTG